MMIPFEHKQLLLGQSLMPERNPPYRTTFITYYKTVLTYLFYVTLIIPLIIAVV